jgi:hypothetical protein
MTIPIVFIIGVPRSGTSIVGRVLDRHPRISTWVEPYYIWDHHFREAPDDERTADAATKEVHRWIRREFTRYWKAFDVDWIVDKSPRNCLKIPFVSQIFPDARYVFINRDGRDTVLSILRQWERKREIFAETEKNGQWQNRIYVLRRWLGRRPTWLFRLQSILFELGSPQNWLKKKFLQQIRWEGRFGWGPRFKGWQEIIDRTTTLEFSACQWVHCAKGIMDNIHLIPKNRRFSLRYEDFIGDPQESVKNIFSFLGMEFPAGFMKKIPEIRAGNSNKWRQAFSTSDLKSIGPIIGKTLMEIGYEKDEAWYQQLEP